MLQRYVMQPSHGHSEQPSCPTASPSDRDRLVRDATSLITDTYAREDRRPGIDNLNVLHEVFSAVPWHNVPASVAVKILVEIIQSIPEIELAALAERIGDERTVMNDHLVADQLGDRRLVEFYYETVESPAARAALLRFAEVANGARIGGAK